MDKQLKDYLHYYLGCQMYAYTLESVTNGWLEKQMSKNPQMGYSYELTAGNLKKTLEDGYLPILRKLESMTEEEAEDLARLVTPKFRWEDIRILEVKPTEIHFMDGSKWYGDGVEEFNDCYISLIEFAPACFHYLLSRGFDLFGLINAGLAVDKATIKS